MKKLMLVVLGSFLSVVLIMPLSYADSHETKVNTPKINKREKRQRALIRRRCNNGKLSAAECTKLKKQQRRIEKAEQRAKSDGVVTRRERKRIHKKLDRSHKNIKKQSND